MSVCTSLPSRGRSCRLPQTAITGRGFILLEVVIAVALLLTGLTVIGAQISQSLESSHRSANLTRLMLLVESQLAELDTGLVNFEEEADNEVEGDFTTRFPDYGWRIRFDETATEALLAITLEILHNPRERLTEEFDHDNAEVVHTVYTLRALPPAIDLQKDFGVEDEAIEQLSELMPVEDFDPANFNPAIFREWEFEDLITVLPALVQAFNISLEELTQMVPPELRELLELAGPEFMEDEEEPLPGQTPNNRGTGPANQAERAPEGRGNATTPGGEPGQRGDRSGMRRGGGGR